MGSASGQRKPHNCKVTVSHLEREEICVFTASFLHPLLCSAESQSPDRLLPPPPRDLPPSSTWCSADLHSLNPYLHFNSVTACAQTQITLLSLDILASKAAQVFPLVLKSGVLPY